MTEENDVSKMITSILNVGKNMLMSQSSEKQDKIKNTASIIFVPIISMLHQKDHAKIHLNGDLDVEEGQEAKTFVNGMIECIFNPEEEISFNLSHDETEGWSTEFDIKRIDAQPDEHQQDSHNRQDLHDLHQHDQIEQLDEEPDLYDISFSSDEEDERLTVKEMLLITVFVCFIALYCFF